MFGELANSKVSSSVVLYTRAIHLHDGLHSFLLPAGKESIIFLHTELFAILT
jgi:hypothetical protein